MKKVRCQWGGRRPIITKNKSERGCHRTRKQQRGAVRHGGGGVPQTRSQHIDLQGDKVQCQKKKKMNKTDEQYLSGIRKGKFYLKLSLNVWLLLVWHRRWHNLHNLLHLLLDGVLSFSTEYILLAIHFMRFVCKGRSFVLPQVYFFNLCVVKWQFYYLSVHSFNHVLLIFSFQCVISKTIAKTNYVPLSF